MRFILKAFVVVFGVGLIASMISSTQNPRPAPEPRQKQAKQQGGSFDLASMTGYTDGKAMAEKGMVKPSSDVVDALSRRRYGELKQFGIGPEFKHNYKAAFWEGWRAGN